MSRKRYTVEQIIHKLREAEVELSRGKKLGQIVRDLGITIEGQAEGFYREGLETSSSCVKHGFAVYFG